MDRLAIVSKMEIVEKVRNNMTNKEKYSNEILTDLMYNYLSEDALIGYGVNPDEYGDITYAQILEWLEQEYEPSSDERLQAKLEEYTELESEEEMEEYKSCDNCKHEDKDPQKYPCKNCNRSDGTEDNWNTDKPKNYIAEFRYDNSLDFLEEFEIEGQDKAKFRISYNELLTIYSDTTKTFRSANSILITKLLSGELKIRKLPKQEYVEVTNDVPRFTEIEVRDEDCEKWVKMLFAFKTNRMDDKYPYVVMDEGKRIVNYYKQARMLKPTEPQFEEGEMIEVSDFDYDGWIERRYLGRFNGYYMCENYTRDNSPISWKYARKIENK